MKEEIETEIYNGWEVPCLLEKSEVVIVGRKVLSQTWF